MKITNNIDLYVIRFINYNTKLLTMTQEYIQHWLEYN
jgi:hypothetical protein